VSIVVDITEISAIAAAMGVIVGVVLTYLEVRNLVRARQTDAFWRVYQSFNSKEFLEAMYKVFNLEFEGYNDFLKKYGPPFAESSVAVALGTVGNLYEGAGELLYRGLADYESVSNIPTSMTWEKMKPIVEGARKQYNFPSLFNKFEYLYNEGKKREQQLAKTK
jgi:hypothetical protein